MLVRETSRSAASNDCNRFYVRDARHLLSLTTSLAATCRHPTKESVTSVTAVVTDFGRIRRVNYIPKGEPCHRVVALASPLCSTATDMTGEETGMKKEVYAGLVLCTLLVMTGCAPGKYVYVDGKNATGPWDGTKANPFTKIQQGLNAAHANKYDGVKVFGGVYNENLTLQDDLSLQPADATTTVLVNGAASAPTITAWGRNYIANLLVDGGSVGVSIDLDKMLSVSDTPLIIVTDNIIESYNAIRVQSGSNLAFPKGVRKKPMVSLSGNWIRKGFKAGGTGIQVEVTGPKTGELGVRLDIEDNIIWEKSTGIALHAKGQGPNPGNFVRTNLIGEVANNLVYGCSLAGIRMDSKNLGDAGLSVFGNTMVYGGSHGIVATAVSGPDGDGSTHPNVTNNILAYNKGKGYLEFSSHTSASDLQHNIFYQNAQGHYEDNETGKTMTTATELNTPLLQNKVVFYNGGGNLVADPRFESGVLHWNGKLWAGEKAGDFFLVQQGTNKSPGVDAGFGSAQDGGFSKKTTSKTYSYDVGKADIGFHYTKQ